LVELAGALARARFAVLVPDLESLRAQRVSPDNVRQIADVLRFMADENNLIVPAGRPLGIAAISYAVGPALLATLQPAVVGKTDFMAAIGGYYDVIAVIAYFTTGYYRAEPGGPWRRGTPNEFGKWLFVAANAVNIADPRDRVALMAMAGRRQQDPSADVGDLVAILGSEGRAVHALLSNREPDRAAELIDALPAGLRDDLLALNLAGRPLADGPARLLLIHGRDDTIIPASESMALAAALPPDKSELFLVDNLRHANLRPGGWRDLWVLWRAAYRLLEMRDG
jgi:pimeloyl-ACP methyl ester carboxylesterase